MWLQVRDDKADEVASYAGIGIGLTTLLRATPFRLIYDEIPIPANLLRADFPFKQLFGEENTLGVDDEAEWNSAVNQMSSTAKAHLDRAKELQTQLPRASRPVFLAMIPSLHFLDRLEAKKYNLMDPELHDPPHLQQLQLLLRLGKGWIMGRV